MSTNTTLDKLKRIIEGALLAAGKPLGIDQILALFMDEDQPSRDEIREAIAALQADCVSRGVELVEVASGFRFQVKSELAEWVSRLWEEKPAKYSRAVLETLALIAYRQPITRSEIEDVRGVSVSSHIVKSLLEREWIRVIGHRDVPGKPALYGTTKIFLDYFGLTSLSDLPPLAELRNIDSIERELDFGQKSEAGDAEEGPEATETETAAEGDIQIEAVALAGSEPVSDPVPATEVETAEDTQTPSADIAAEASDSAADAATDAPKDTEEATL